MAVAGALIGGAIGAFGEKPIIPDFKRVDTTREQKLAVEGNLANLPEIQQIGAGVNAFNADQINKMLETILPGTGAMKTKAVSVISDLLAGKLPQDVADLVASRANARSLAGGYGGSQAAGNLTARDLGLTSLQATQQGLDSAGRWIQSTQAGLPMFDLTSMFISPTFKAQFEFGQNQAQFQRDMMAAEVAAAPDPKTAALGKEIDRFFNTVAKAAMAYGGGAMGGGGMGGMGGGGMGGLSGMMQGGGGGGGGGEVMGGWGYGGGGGFGGSGNYGMTANINNGSANGQAIV